MKTAKTLKWILCLCCLLAALFAFTLAAHAKTVASGVFGDYGNNLSWTLDDAGTLTISRTLTINGGGNMWWEEAEKQTVWSKYRKDIRSVVIGDSVTSIGHGAFMGCTGLKEITIPESVTEIGSSAFSGCTGITKVIIPSGITRIGSGAFSYCSGLTQLSVAEGNVKYYSQGNCVIDEEEKALIAGCQNSTIPDDGSVTLIGISAFLGCTGLKSIAIPNSVDRIEAYAFKDCSGLTKIDLPSSVTYIGDYAFEGCRGLTSILIPGKVNYIGSKAFGSCPDLKTITVDKNNKTFYSVGNCIIENKTKSVFSIGDWSIIDKETKTLICGCNNSIIPQDGSIDSIGECTFSGCSGLVDVSIPDGVESIESSAFENCTGLRSVHIPKSVSDISCYAFNGCTGLTEFIISKENEHYYEEGNCLIEKSSETLICGCKNSIIPNDGSVTSIGNGAFEGLNNITSISIPKSITDIGERAFFKCSGLTSVLIPESVTHIGEHAFYGCTGLTSITIPNSVKDIEEWAFHDCTGLIHVTIPNSITKISGAMFAGCTSLKSITIPRSVTSIGGEAFFGCTNLMCITIPDSVTEINNDAFTDCDNLKDIYYSGSAEQWGSIDIMQYTYYLLNDYWLGNKPLFSATIHYNEPSACLIGFFEKYTTANTPDGKDSSVSAITIDGASYRIKEGVLTPPTAALYKNNDVRAMINNGIIESVALITNPNRVFRLGTDNNSFRHIGRNFFQGYVKGTKTYRDAIDQVYIDKLEKIRCSGDLNRDLDKEWEGSCFGIAMTMGLLYEDRIMISDLSKQKSVEDYHSLPLPVNDRSFVSIINYYQLSQSRIKSNSDTLIAETYSERFGNLENSKDSPLELDDFLKKLIEYYHQNHVLQLGYTYDKLDEKGERESTGHAVLITGITYDMEKNVFDVSIYDENTIDSNGDKGKFLTMTIASDYSSFSFVDDNHIDANIDVYNIYKQMDILDPTKVDENLIFRNSGVRNASASEPQRCTIYVPFDKDFTLSNTEGKLLTCKSGYFEGNMPIYTSYTIHNTESPYFVFETDRSDLFSLTEIQDGMEIRVFDSDDHFVSFEGNHLDQVNLGIDSGVELQGTEYDFKVYLSTDSQGNESDGLIAVSADADGKTEIAKNGSGLAVHSDHPLKNVETASYGDDEIKKENADICALTFSIDEDATISNDSAIVYGDVDGDGKISAADARLALRASVGLKEPGDVEKGSAAYLACDVDGDGKVTSADARLILRASVGLEDASKFGKKV